MPIINPKHLIFLFSWLFWSGLAIAQETSNTAGGNAFGNGGNVAFSIGQIVYTSNTGSSGNISPGVQHAYEIFILGTEESESNSSFIVFPNPITENLTLENSISYNQKLEYQLLDMQGKLIGKGSINSAQTLIMANSLTNGTYFLHVLKQGNKKVQTFKIIKN